jgi:hypothetical protein
MLSSAISMALGELHILLLLFLTRAAVAQQVQCNTLPDGCDAGAAYQAVVEDAIARFEPTRTYGNQLDIFSTALDGGVLAQISYACQDGTSPPPLLSGSAARYL